MTTPFSDYEAMKRRHVRLSRLEARDLERHLEAARELPVLATSPDHVGRWIAFFIGAVILLAWVLTW